VKLATHCANGHEYTSENTYYYAPGSRRLRYCRSCMRAGHARYREKRRKPPPERYPAEPLRRQLRLMAAKYEEAVLGGVTSGMRALAEIYAARFGYTPSRAENRLESVMKNHTVSPEMADELSILIGLHPQLIWPEWEGALG
jgi:hypothetical protein